MADTIQVTPQMLRSTANDIQANMEQAWESPRAT